MDAEKKKQKRSAAAAEKYIRELFPVGQEFVFKDKKYSVEKSGKPTCGRDNGEPKTDIYVSAAYVEDENEKIELKISYKKKNADFIENKISAERAKQILGNGWKRILTNRLKELEGKFEEIPLVYYDKKGKTDQGSIALGWRFELVDKKKNGKLSGDLKLTEKQLIEAYKGAKNVIQKRNAKVNGEEIKNSGVADYMLRIDSEDLHSAQDVIEHLVPIEKYVREHPQATYVCKALNYWTKEMHDDKRWEGDRPLAIYVEWSEVDGKLTPNLIMNNPLMVRGNTVANRLEKYLQLLNITDTDDLTKDNLGTDKAYRKKEKPKAKNIKKK